jgi:DMSO reductase family type II enzyme molybdopterin subunit
MVNINNSNGLPNQERRKFLKQAGGITAVLSVSSLTGALSPVFIKDAVAGETVIEYAAWEDIYRKEWKWDRVTWGSHTNICWPQGSCSYRVYTRNGIVWREEQTAKTSACNPGYSDYNPLGCQKGAAFSNNLYGEDRVLYPMRRAGKRGEGKWQRISWDEAVTDVADAILDSFESQGSDGFILDAPHVHAGSVAWGGGFRMNYLLDGVTPDTNVDIGDTYMGTWTTFGKMHNGYTADNLLDAELIFMTCSNWSYTYPSGYHFLTEARYKGAEVVVVAPDFNPTTPACDIHVPVRVGTDAAFWLGLCHVMLQEDLVNKEFVKEQTDMPLLVRSDTRRFLRMSDLEDGGRDNQFYFYDNERNGIVKAPRDTLLFKGDQALEGSYQVRLKNGQMVTVKPVYEFIKEKLDEYTPEKASALCGVHPTQIRELARKVATKRTCSYIGFSSAKSYHGDLFERSFCLAMALSGNWGKPGTGFYIWAYPEDGMFFIGVMDKPTAKGGMDAFKALEHQIQEDAKKEDPDANEETASIKLVQKVTQMMGVVPPAYWLYHHAGYDKLWNRKEWQDPALKQTFGEYFQEAVDKGWWAKEYMRPAPDKTPQVLMVISHNPLRRKRSGSIQYPEVLFPKLKMIFALETRMSATVMYSDIVLPCAWYYEKEDMTTPCTGNPFFAYIDASVKPAGECKPEWEIMAMIMKKIGERAKARGMVEFTDHFGQKRKYSELYDRFTMNGYLKTHGDVVREMCEINVAAGVFPKGYSYEQLKKDGQQKFVGMGLGASRFATATTYDVKKPFFSFQWHVDDKLVFPTEAKRAQFYIDHPWYMEAGETLPTHKDTPMIGGDHPFKITGGHPRVSIHSTHLTNSFFSRLHRGQPVMHMNPDDAAEYGLKDGDRAVVYNDFNEFEIMVKPAPNISPKQVIVYFWDATQYKDWKPYDTLLIGIPKALHWAGGYEQFRYYFMNGSPAPVTDRGVRVSIRKA